jgi:hypothetical protein
MAKKLLILAVGVFVGTCVLTEEAECSACTGKVCRYSTDCTPLCDCLKLNGRLEGVCL